MRIPPLFLAKTLRSENSSERMMMFLTLSGLVSNLLTISSGLLVASWLLPEELGLFNSFSIITSYIILIQIGIPSGLSRQYPYYLAKDQKQESLNYAATAQYWSLLLSIIIGVISSSATLYFLINSNWEYAAGVFVIGITAFDGFYVSKYLKILFRSNNDFNKLSVINIIVAVTSFISIIFVWHYGFFGLCFRAIATALVNFIFTWYWKPVSVYPKYAKKYFSDLLKVGMPIYFVANLYSLWPILQRTIVLSIGGVKALGLYGLALMVESSMSIISTSISSVAFPKLNMVWAKAHSFNDLLKVIIKPILIGFIICIILTIAGWFILPYFIRYFLPNFVDAIQVTQWTLIVGLFAIFSVYSNIYMVMQRNMDRLITYILGFLFWALVLFILINLRGFSLEIFPQAMLFGYFGIYLADIYFYGNYKVKYI